MRKLLRNVTAVALLAGLTLNAMSCASVAAKRTGTDEDGWWGDHFGSYVSLFKHDLTNIYQSFDRHFMDLDWDDPRY